MNLFKTLSLSIFSLLCVVSIVVAIYLHDYDCPIGPDINHEVDFRTFQGNAQNEVLCLGTYLATSVANYNGPMVTKIILSATWIFFSIAIILERRNILMQSQSVDSTMDLLRSLDPLDPQRPMPPPSKIPIYQQSPSILSLTSTELLQLLLNSINNTTKDSYNISKVLGPRPPYFCALLSTWTPQHLSELTTSLGTGATVFMTLPEQLQRELLSRLDPDALKKCTEALQQQAINLGLKDVGALRSNR